MGPPKRARGADSSYHAACTKRPRRAHTAAASGADAEGAAASALAPATASVLVTTGAQLRKRLPQTCGVSAAAAGGLARGPHGERAGPPAAAAAPAVSAPPGAAQAAVARPAASTPVSEPCQTPEQPIAASPAEQRGARGTARPTGAAGAGGAPVAETGTALETGQAARSGSHAVAPATAQTAGAALAAGPEADPATQPRVRSAAPAGACAPSAAHAGEAGAAAEAAHAAGAPGEPGEASDTLGRRLAAAAARFEERGGGFTRLYECAPCSPQQRFVIMLDCRFGRKHTNK